MLQTQIQSFIDYLTFEKKYSKHTITSYQNDLAQFLEFIEIDSQNSDAKEINYQIIRSWISELVENAISPKSINRKLSTLKSFFKYLQRLKMIDNNPMSKLSGPKIPKRLPVFIDEHDMEKLFTNIEFEASINGLRDKLILDLLYQTGIRRSEISSLKEIDIDNQNNTIKVLGKRNKERLIPISIALKRNLNEYISVKQKQNLSNDYLLLNNKGEKMSEQNIYQIVKKYLSLITSIHKKSPHILRHTFATHLLNNGADINAVKDLLGHANLSATQVYTHNTIDKLKKSYKQAHPRGDS
jgi:integrase/recombinase XerC